MLSYTQCKQCGDTLQVTYVGQESHPTCPQTEAEILARHFIDAIQRGDDAEAQRLERVIDKPQPLPPLGSVALWYAEQGWPVLPILPGKKIPATKHGVKDATTDTEWIGNFWASHPESNIGLATGFKFDCIDLDGPEGIESFAKMQNIPDVHGKVSTPRGMHMYIKPTGLSNKVGLAPGVDFRAQGGFVLAPPSQVDTKRYSWVLRPSPEILGG